MGEETMINQRISKLVIGAVLSCCIICNGCNGKNGASPPSVEDIAGLVEGGTMLACIAIPEGDRVAARGILIQILTLSATDPQAAYDMINSQSVLTFGAVKMLWHGLHVVLSRHATNAAQWTEFAVQATGPAARGCLTAIGYPPTV